MTKVAIIGDMHFGVKNGNNDFLEFQFYWLEECLKKLQAMGVTHIIQTGDMFDNRQHIKMNVLYAMITRFPSMLMQYGITKWTSFGGNHDMFYKDRNEISSLELFKVFDKIDDAYCNVEFETYTDKVGYQDIGGKKFAFVPWVNKFNYEDLINVDLMQSPAEYVFGHFEMVGMPMIPGVVCEHGVEPKEFKRFKRVISGHFHTVSHSLNCTMVGTPYHLTWGDVQDGDNRGFWILDTDTDDLTLHKNDEFMTLFSVLEYDGNQKYDDKSFDNFAGNIVKVLVREKAEPKHFKKFTELLTKAKFIDYKIIDTTMVQIDKVEISEEVLGLDTLSAMNAYIDGQGDEVNKDDVKALAKSVYLEVLNGGTT